MRSASPHGEQDSHVSWHVGFGYMLQANKSSGKLQKVY